MSISEVLMKIVITDYPDVELIENIRHNVANCGIGKTVQAKIAVEGYLWGSDAAPLLVHLYNYEKFDVIILSDTVCFHCNIT
jgi:EEF1A N-terminal glycine/lysine methyltransferase